LQFQCSQLKKITKEFGATSAEAQEAAKKVDALKKEIEKVPNTVKSFKTQLKEATAELVNMSEKFGVTSNEAAAAARKVAGLKDAIGDAKALADTFNPDKKFVALGGALQGAVGGFSALQGAMGLFGSEGKEVEKVMLKVQSAMALQQGISAIMGAKDSFDLMKDGAIKAFQAIRAGIGSTGIGLFVLALGAIVAYWDDIKGAVSGVSEEQTKLNAQSQKNLDIQEKKVKAISEQENLLKLQGFTEEEILNKKIAATAEAIKEARIRILNAENIKLTTIEATERNKEFLASALKGISAPITLLLQGIDLAGKAFGKNFGLADKFFKGISNLVFDPVETAKKGDETIQIAKDKLTELENEKAGFQLQVKAIQKAEADKEAAEQLKKDEAEKKRLEDLAKFQRDLQTSLNKDKAQALTEAEAEFAANEKAQQEQLDREKSYSDAAILLRQQNTERVLAADKLAKDTLKQNEIDLANARKEIQDATFNNISAGLDLIQSLAGKNKALQAAALIAESAVGIAKIVINTQAANAAARLKYALIPGGIAIAKTETLLNNISAGIGIAANLKATATGLRGLNSGGAPSAPGGMSAVGGTSAPLTPQAQSTRLDQGSINAIGQASARSYVLESDVTSHQERIQRLQRAARIN